MSLDRESSTILPVGVTKGSAQHAAGLYRRLFDAALRPLHTVEAEAHHLHEVEKAGQSGEAPFIAILGLVLFLAPIFALMLGLALLAAYLVG
ncbi:MAG TPA: hypothetical protein VGH82_00640 [Gaiellaceae bacterium]|jgi:hypothetical protein